MPETDDIVAALRAADAVRFGEFELSHGGTSDYYVDKYRFETVPDCLALLAEAFAARVGDTKLAGVALGAVPLVAAASVATGNPYVIARKQAKEYGTGNRIEGRLSEGEEVVVIEDIATPARALSTPSRRSGRPGLSSSRCSSSSTARRVPANTSPTTVPNWRRS